MATRILRNTDRTPDNALEIGVASLTNNHRQFHAEGYGV